MLNFDQVGSHNLDKLPTNWVDWVLAVLLYLINFAYFESLCSILGRFTPYTSSGFSLLLVNCIHLAIFETYLVIFHHFGE